MSSATMSSETKNSHQKKENPGPATTARLVGQYFLNDELDDVTLSQQVDMMAEAGYQAVCAHARQGLTTPYMSENWWRSMDTIITACERNNLQFWIWDEDYYPSGLAGGRIIWDDPGIMAQGLAFAEFELEEGKSADLDFPEGMLLSCHALRMSHNGEFEEAQDVTKYCGTRRQAWTGRFVRHGAYSPLVAAAGRPHWRAICYDNRFSLQWTPEMPARHKIVAVLRVFSKDAHADIMSEEAMKRFLDITHEEYFKRFGEKFGSIITGTFTDEPRPSQPYPWNKSFAEDFQKDHGYDIGPLLYALHNEDDPRYRQVRTHYRQTQFRLQYNAYIKTMGDWCTNHNIEFAGHLSRTEWMGNAAISWPNQLRFYKGLDVPSTDPLGWVTVSSDQKAYHTGLKVASSAANLFGKKHAGSDALAIIGEEASLGDIRFQLDYQMALGISQFTLHGLSYSYAGPRKDEVPPSLFYQHSQWPYMQKLMEHTNNICEKMSGSAPVGGALLLYPHTQLAIEANPEHKTLTTYLTTELERSYHDTVEELVSAHVNFDLIDEVTLDEAAIEGNSLQINAEYSAVIIPNVDFIGKRAADKLADYAAAGGKVLLLGKAPEIIPASIEETPNKITAQKFISCNNVRDALPHVQAVKAEGKGHEFLFINERKVGTDSIYFVLNASEHTFNGTIAGRKVIIEGHGSLLLEPGKESAMTESAIIEDGESIIEIASPWQITFPENTVPLNFWEVREDLAPDTFNEFSHGPEFDLLSRRLLSDEDRAKAIACNSRFMLKGAVSDMELIVEKIDLENGLSIFVNGKEISDWKNAGADFCGSVCAPVGEYLVHGSGSIHRLNTITALSEKAGVVIDEMVYLRGSFSAEFRTSHISVPHLAPSIGTIEKTSLIDWRNLGYPAFAGTAVYSQRFTLPDTAPENLYLDLGRVESIAEVTIDGESVGTMCWAPYAIKLPDLKSGEHEIKIKITNRTANRNRLAGLPAGLFGPVRIKTTK